MAGGRQTVPWISAILFYACLASRMCNQTAKLKGFSGWVIETSVTLQNANNKNHGSL